MMVGHRDAVYEEESAEVEVLFNEAAKLAALQKKFQAVNNRLQDGGNVMKDALGSAYGSTQSLQVMNKNIDNLIDCIERLQKPLEGKEREERIIRAGPANVGLQSYLTSLKRVDHSLSELSRTNLRVNQQGIVELRQLVEHGTNELEELFGSVLREDARVVEPLHFITKQLPFPTIQQEKVSQLGSIDGFISSWASRTASYNQRDSPTIRIYAETRGPYISGSLQNLAAGSINTARKKTPNELYRPRTNGIGTYASGVEGILLAEFQIITAIFSRDEWGTAFEQTSRGCMSEFSKTLRELNTHIRSNITTDCILAYEIIEVVTGLSYRLDSKTGQLKQQFLESLRPIRDTAKSSLSELLVDTKSRIQSLQMQPTDCASLSITTETIDRLESLLNYPQPLGAIMTSVGNGNWSNPSANGSSASVRSFDVGADGNQLLPQYILDTIETLVTSLDLKSKVVFKSRSLAGLFVANNISVVNDKVRTSGLREELASTNYASKMSEWRKQSQGKFTDSWREPCGALMDVTRTGSGAGRRPPSGASGTIDSAQIIKGLNNKEKDMIKEKFKSFNASFEQLSRDFKGMPMEPEVKESLTGDIRRMVEPLYGRFWDRYHEIDKGKGKYVKYDKASFAGELASL